MIDIEGHISPFCTANPSKLIEKDFLDLRNMFSNEENIRNKNISQNKTNFLDIKKTLLSKKVFLVSRKLFLF